MCLRVSTYLLFEAGVGKQVEKGLGNLVVVIRSAEVFVFVVENLQWGTSGSVVGDGKVSVEGLGNPGFKTLTRREPKNDVGNIQESIQDCTGMEINVAAGVLKLVGSRWSLGDPQDDNIIGALLALGGGQVENLVTDNAGVGVIDRTVSTGRELGSLGFFNLSARRD